MFQGFLAEQIATVADAVSQAEPLDPLQLELSIGKGVSEERRYGSFRK